MKRLLMHQHTKRLADGYANEPTHALLLVGPKGAGKGTLAAHLAEQALELGDKPLADYAYKLHVEPENDNGTIGIEVIRNLEKFLSLKVPRATKYNRAVIVEQADGLTPEAQNALLKTLEEPPEGTILMLTATHENALLPTIVSRTQTLPVQRPAREELINYFGQTFPGESIEQTYAITSGLPGLMQSLLEEEDHPLKQATEMARNLLQQTAYERLLEVDALAKDKTLAADTVYILQQMAHVGLQLASGTTAKKWQIVLKASHEASEALRINGQPKLVLTNLMLHL